MKQIGWAILILLVLHLLAVAGGMAWLASTGRISAERVRAVAAAFELPVAEEAAEAAKAAEMEAKTRELAMEAAKLEAVADGPLTLSDRLAMEEVKDDLAMHRLEQLKRQTDDLRQQMERTRELLIQQKADLEAERREFEAFVAAKTTELQEADFQRAVQTYDQLKPRQVKEMFQQLLATGESDRVVEYMTSMQLRKSAAVLKEFKTPEEVQQATLLIEELRKRGVYAGDPDTLAGASP